MPNVHTGRCNCGAVGLRMKDAPKRVAVCHCQTCRRATGSPYLAIAVWPTNDVKITGKTESWMEKTYRRYFCPTCGSSVYGTDTTDEIDIHLGVLDAAPTLLKPTYEIWTERREHWLEPLEGTDQYMRGRPQH